MAIMDNCCGCGEHASFYQVSAYIMQPALYSYIVASCPDGGAFCVDNPPPDLLQNSTEINDMAATALGIVRGFDFEASPPVSWLHNVVDGPVDTSTYDFYSLAYIADAAGGYFWSNTDTGGPAGAPWGNAIFLTVPGGGDSWGPLSGLTGAFGAFVNCCGYPNAYNRMVVATRTISRGMPSVCVGRRKDNAVPTSTIENCSMSSGDVDLPSLAITGFDMTGATSDSVDLGWYLNHIEVPLYWAGSPSGYCGSDCTPQY